MQNFVYATTIIPGSSLNNLIIPSSMGKIIDSFKGIGNDKIILIQDLHCQPNVQKNIYKIFTQIKKTYGKTFQL
jgi:hypothetical protein